MVLRLFRSAHSNGAEGSSESAGSAEGHAFGGGELLFELGLANQLRVVLERVRDLLLLDAGKHLA